MPLSVSFPVGLLCKFVYRIHEPAHKVWGPDAKGLLPPGEFCIQPTDGRNIMAALADPICHNHICANNTDIQTACRKGDKMAASDRAIV